MLENLLTPETRTDPYPFYRQVFDRGPVFAAADGFFVVSGGGDVHPITRGCGGWSPRRSRRG